MSRYGAKLWLMDLNRSGSNSGFSDLTGQSPLWTTLGVKGSQVQILSARPEKSSKINKALLNIFPTRELILRPILGDLAAGVPASRPTGPMVPPWRTALAG
jgi:hypothetical protein